MTCKCGSERILLMSAKCSDLCSASFGKLEHDGYVPTIDAFGGGDYLEIEVCMDCGYLQDFQPLTDREIEAAFKGVDEEDLDEELDDDYDDDAFDPITGRSIKRA